jgi:glutamine---fructose-6-phosphate transaminase (isomerizing)
MCGIIGYVGSEEAKPILLKGLQALEYRGYDSAGIYVSGNGLTRSVGAVANLIEKASQKEEGGGSGIAHTRWATHGPPTEANAHPHHDERERVYLVHNGIIENYRELKDELAAEGAIFYSDTDTEVLAQYIASLLTDGTTLEHAVKEALSRVRGTYGIAVMEAGKPEEIVVARMGSPLVVGITPHGHLIASDPSALLAHTKEVVYLEDGQYAILTKESCTVVDRAHGVQQPKVETIEWDLESVQKSGYDHFLIKEIMDIPEAIENTLRGRLIAEEGRAKLGGLEPVLDRLAGLERIILVACGSAAYAATLGKYIIEEYAKIPVDVEIGSEFRYRTVIPHEKTALIAITQSGETADTLASVRKGKELGLLTLGIVNVVGSTIARETDAGVYNHAGPEISIASTKAVISQVVALTLLSLLIGRARNMTKEEGVSIAEALRELPDLVRKVLEGHDHVRAIAEKYARHTDMMYIGRKFHAPMAYEGSLKLKEVTYVHAEAYAGGELKHGAIALLDENFPVVAMAPQDDVYEKMISNIEEVKARNAPVIAIANEGDEAIAKIADDVIYVPKAHPVIQPLLSVIPTYLFAYYVGVAKGLNVDRPRNLAKSVTVE